MEWLSREASLSAAPVPDVALLEQAVAANPAAAPLHGRLAAAHFARQDFAGAAASFAEAERLDPAGFRAWEPFAASLVRIGAYAEALAACDRALDRGAGDGLRHYRGTALRRLGRREEGRADLERALVSGDRQFHTLKALLRPMSAKPDGGPLLDYCDALPPAYRRCAGANAYRAIALSRLGREEEANAMVDLDRHVVLDRFEPPAEFGGIEAFNRLLAEEILRDPPPGAKRDGFDINYAPRRGESPAFAALSAFTRSRIEAYVARLEGFGLAEILGPPPAAGSLGRATGVLRREGTNGEHIHAGNYISTVYYVAVPREVLDADDDRGALVMGKCSDNTRGYQACWGKRVIRPQPGVLTLFPSHVFHDVIPPLSEEPRIVVAADLRPEKATS
jgi:tetratricopeptide (TPR) repeat protein